MKRFKRFSLLSLLILITAFGVWFGVSSNRAGKLRRAVEALSNAGCRIGYDFQYDGLRSIANLKPPGPEYLRKLLGDEHFVDVVNLSFQSNERTTNQDLEYIKDLPNVRRLDLDYTVVDEIEPVKHLARLQWLDLEETKISSDDLRHLKDCLLYTSDAADE